MMNPLRLMPLLLLFLYVSACSPIPLEMNFAFDLPENQKIAVKAKYLVSPKLCKSVFNKHTLGGGGLVPAGRPGVATGEALCAGIDNFMHAAFMDAVRITSEQTLITSNEVLVVPKLLAIDMFMPYVPGEDNKVLIKMQWTVTDAKGNILWTDTIKGSAKRWCFSLGCKQGNVKLAIQDQFQKALKSMMRHEWWKPAGDDRHG